MEPHVSLWTVQLELQYIAMDCPKDYGMQQYSYRQGKSVPDAVEDDSPIHNLLKQWPEETDSYKRNRQTRLVHYGLYQVSMLRKQAMGVKQVEQGAQH